MPIRKGARNDARIVAKSIQRDVDVLRDDEEPDEEGERHIHAGIEFIRMWPRAIFSSPSEERPRRGRAPAVAMGIPALDSSGVYILYRDDQPYYVGQTKGKLTSRLRKHANGVGGLRTYFWNYFSAFLVDDPSQIDKIEAILISAMPSVLSNSSAPKLERQKMGPATRAVIRKLRETGQF